MLFYKVESYYIGTNSLDNDYSGVYDHNDRYIKNKINNDLVTVNLRSDGNNDESDVSETLENNNKNSEKEKQNVKKQKPKGSTGAKAKETLKKFGMKIKKKFGEIKNKLTGGKKSKDAKKKNIKNSNK